MAAALPRSARADPRPKRVAILWVQIDSPSPPQERRDYEQRFERHGYRLGDTVEVLWFETVLKDERTPRVGENVQRIVEARPDVIIASGTIAAELLRKATTEIPVVINLGVGDPVEQGLAQSLSRPGGNFTGIYLEAYDAHLKRLDILKQLVPRLSCVGWIAFAPQLSWFPTFERAAHAAGLRVRKVVGDPFEDRLYARVRREVAALRSSGCAAAHFFTSVQPFIDAVTAAALETRLVLSHSSEPRSDAAMISLDPIFATPGMITAGRLVPLAAKILDGQRPAQIPFEGPVGYRLLVNRTLATRWGIAVPPSLLLAADEVV